MLSLPASAWERALERHTPHGARLHGVDPFAWRFWKIAPWFCMRWTDLHGNRKFARRWPVCMKIRENRFPDTLACYFAWCGCVCLVIADLKIFLGHIKTPVSARQSSVSTQKRISRPQRLVFEHSHAKVCHCASWCTFGSISSLVCRVLFCFPR